MEQIKNFIIQTWNDWTTSASSSAEDCVPDEIPQNLLESKAADTAFMRASPSLDRRMTDDAEIFSTQQKEGILKAAGYAIVSIGDRYDAHLKGENLLNKGLISTCNTNPDAPTICIGSHLSANCVTDSPSSPENYPFPMILNTCVGKFYKDQLPKLLKGQPDAACFEMGYRFDTSKIEETEPRYGNPHRYEINLDACIGHEGVEGTVKLDNAFQAVRDGDLKSAKGVLFACEGSEIFDSSLECLSEGNSKSHYGYPLPKNNDFAKEFFNSLLESTTECYRFEYAYTPTSYDFLVCQAAVPLAVAEN